MLVMTYTDARANFATLLNRVKSEGAAIIKRADGDTFRITVEEPEAKSPFAGVRRLANIPVEEVMDAVRESRERS